MMPRSPHQKAWTLCHALLILILFFTFTHAQNENDDDEEIRDYFDTLTDEIFEIIHSKIANAEDVHHTNPPKSPLKGLESFSEAFTRPRKLMNRVYWKSAVLNEMDMDESWKLGIFRTYPPITNHTVDGAGKWRQISKCLHSPVPSIQMGQWWREIRRHEQNPTLNATYRPYTKPNNSSAIKFLLDLEYYPNASSVLSPKELMAAKENLSGSSSAHNSVLTGKEESQILRKLERGVLEILGKELSVLFPTFNFTMSHFAHIVFRAVATSYEDYVVNNDGWIQPPATRSLIPTFPTVLQAGNSILKRFIKKVESVNRDPTDLSLLKEVYSIVFASYPVMKINRGQLMLFENGDLSFEIIRRPGIRTFLVGALRQQRTGVYRGKIEIEIEAAYDNPIILANIKLPIVKTGRDGIIGLKGCGSSAEDTLENLFVEIKSNIVGKMGLAVVTSANVIMDKEQNGEPNKRRNVLFSLRNPNSLKRCISAARL